jgi:hypothetical protein
VPVQSSRAPRDAQAGRRRADVGTRS